MVVPFLFINIKILKYEWIQTKKDMLQKYKKKEYQRYP